MSQSEYYQLPEGHDDSMKGFFKVLVGGFLLLVFAIITFVWNADKILIHIPFEMEQKFVRPYEEFFEEYGVYSSSDYEMENYLKKLTKDLTAAMHIPSSMPIKIHLVDSDIENAFATLGGHIIVFTGLVNNLNDENSLAMVIAHEIGHIKHRDPIVSLGRGALIQIIYGFITGNTSAGNADLIFNSGTEVGMLFFSREQESRADLAAIEGLVNNYGHAAGATTFFKHILSESESTDDLPAWLSSHPKMKERIDVMNKYIEQHNLEVGSVTEFPFNKSQTRDYKK